MPRKNIIKVTEEIISVLKKEDDLSVKSISERVNSQWRTTIKSLDFLKNLGIVREKKGKKINKEERLFSLKDKSLPYGKFN